MIFSFWAVLDVDSDAVKCRILTTIDMDMLCVLPWFQIWSQISSAFLRFQIRIQMQ